MKNSKIQWTDHTLNFWWGCAKVSPACAHCYAETVAKVFGKRLFGTVPQWGKGQPRFERLKAARKEALAINKEASKCRVIDDVVWIYTGSTQIIGRPETFRITTCPQGIPLKKREFTDRREFTREEWDKAPQWRPRVFVNSMSDWLDNEVPIEWLAYLLETLFLCPNLDFQLLTKRPEDWHPRCREVYDDHAETRGANFEDGLLDWLKGTPPPNLWIGVTAENQEWADKRIPHLLKIPAQVRFLSCEPLLAAVNIFHDGGTLDRLDKEGFLDNLPFNRSNPFLIHWVIAGGESGGHARPSHPDWFRSLREQCQAAGVPFFFKQWGEFLPARTHGSHLPQDKKFKAKTVQGSGIPYPGEVTVNGHTLMIRAGTDLAGRLLDGQEWSQFPSVA